MLKIALAFAALVAFLTAAQAQVAMQETTTITTTRTVILPTPQQTTPAAAFNLTCPRGDDTVKLELAFDGGTTDAVPSHFSIGHQLQSGGFYDRSRQYHDTTKWNTPGKWEYYWSGAANNFRNTLMIGKLVRHDDGQWFYGEMTSVNGRISPVNVFPCY